MTTHKHKILSLIILTISHLNCYANTLIRVLCSVDSCENCDVFSLMDSVNKLQTFLLWLSAQIRPLFAAKYSGASIGISDLYVFVRGLIHYVFIHLFVIHFILIFFKCTTLAQMPPVHYRDTTRWVFICFAICQPLGPPRGKDKHIY